MGDLKPKYTNLRGLNTNIQRVVTVFTLVISSGAVLLGTSPVSAASKTAYVGHVATVGHNTSCTDPGYKSVQAAVDAVPANSTVYLCGAPYAEQVFVGKSLTFEGDPGAGLTAVGTTFAASASKYPSKFGTDHLALPQALLVQTAGTVNASGLSFDGPMPGNGGCAMNEFGILELGGKLNLSNSTVANIADSNTSLYGCQFGVGIQVGRVHWPTSDFSTDLKVNFAATANMDNVTVTGYQKNGITVDGHDSKANISDSTVTGGGSGAPFGTIIAQNGIQISRGATGNIYKDSISDNAYSAGGFATAAGVLVYGGCGDAISSGVNVYKDTFADNDVAVDFAEYNAGCSAPPSVATDNNAFSDTMTSAAVTNTTGLCDGSVGCGGGKIGYQAGVQDIGNGDNIYALTVSGVGYTEEGTYNYHVTPPVFTKTGPDMAFVRKVDAGDSFPTLNATVYDIH